MKRYFTHYWTNATWDALDSQDGELLNYAGENLFRKRDVGRGDAIYVVTVRKGRLYLLGRLTVARICSFAEATKLLASDVLWPAREHIIAASATPMRFDSEVPIDINQQLLFAASGTGSPLRFLEPGYLDQQTLRGVRELEPASARLLDELLPADTLIPKATKDA